MLHWAQHTGIMRSTRHHLLVPVLISLMACTGEGPTASPAELLIGKWKFETMNLPEVAKAQMDDQARVQFAMMLNQMQPLKYSFFEDGT